MNYNSLNQNLKKRFGKKVYKLALSINVTCPNRDGTLDTRGCIFCSHGGSGEFAEGGNDITAQIERAKSRVVKKAGANAGYIAYFQSFTNTYGDINYLERVFFEAINHPDIVGISIGTRPDCLGDEVLSLLKRLAKIKPLWVELGLQTMHEKTAEYIRRGYETSVYDSAVKKLHAVGAEVVTHIILGLPYETEEMMLDTVRHAVRCGTDGIKLQLLHVLSGTDLEKEYVNQKFTTFELDGYVSLLAKCVEIIPEEVVIHRLTGDGAKKLLVAPLWSADKKRVLNTVNKYFLANKIEQGTKS